MPAAKAKLQTQHHAASSTNLYERVEKLQELQERLGHAQHSALHKILHLRSMRHGRQAKVPLGFVVTGLCVQKRVDVVPFRSPLSVSNDRVHVFAGFGAGFQREAASHDIGAYTARTFAFGTYTEEYWTYVCE